MAIRKFILSFLVLLGLSGCYESQVAVYDSSEYFPYKGTFICNIMGMGTKLLRIEEEKNGIIFPSYNYYLIDPKKNKKEKAFINKVDDDLYVSQEKSVGGDGVVRHQYYFFVADNDKEFFIAAGGSRGAGIRELAERYGVSIKKISRGMDKVYHLTGSKSGLQRFLENHDKNMVTPVASCRAER